MSCRGGLAGWRHQWGGQRLRDKTFVRTLSARASVVFFSLSGLYLFIFGGEAGGPVSNRTENSNELSIFTFFLSLPLRHVLRCLLVCHYVLHLMYYCLPVANPKDGVPGSTR